jgi:hypothetical protein
MSDVLANKYSQYAEALASQGRLQTAMTYLSQLNDPVRLLSLSLSLAVPSNLIVLCCAVCRSSKRPQALSCCTVLQMLSTSSPYVTAMPSLRLLCVDLTCVWSTGDQAAGVPSFPFQADQSGAQTPAVGMQRPAAPTPGPYNPSSPAHLVATPTQSSMPHPCKPSPTSSSSTLKRATLTASFLRSFQAHRSRPACPRPCPLPCRTPRHLLAATLRPRARRPSPPVLRTALLAAALRRDSPRLPTPSLPTLLPFR